MPAVTQPPIGSYALIGDGRTAALCSAGGSIDWLCVPRFDSQPLFSALLAGDRGGRFSIRVRGASRFARRYRPDSAVLETRWRAPTGEARLTEGMVVDVADRLLPRLLLVRRLEVRRGSVDAEILFDPRLGLPGRPPARVERRGDAVVCLWGSLAVAVHAAPDLRLAPGSPATVRVVPGRPVTVAVAVADREPLVLVDPDAAFRALEDSDRSWRRWAGDLGFGGDHRDQVVRSLLTLRLLTYSPSGAPVAAPTTSLPETIGGDRNWDYRFSWPRDASLGVDAFLGLGRPEEAHTYIHWLLHATRITRPRVEVLYTLDGKPGSDEHEVDGVTGYRGSRPVRLGNGARDQHQLDVYGWVLDAAASMEGRGRRLHGETWRAMADLADFVAGNWRRPDAGIWERRGDPIHHVHSKLMAWVALERALRLARSRRTRARRLGRWSRERDAAAVEIQRRGWDESAGAYTGAFDSGRLDAAVLPPLVEFEGTESPRLAATVHAIRRELAADGALLFRYPPGSDGLDGTEGAFLPASFWLVETLARMRRIDEAGEAFEDLCRRSNDVGLFAEEMDPATGEHLGNFPLALTHASMVRAACTLRDATGGGSRRGWLRRRRARRA